MPTTAQVVHALGHVVDHDDPPSWVEIHPTPDAEAATFVRHHDLSGLFGWVAPPGCWAVGVVAGGWGHTTPAGSEAPGPDRRAAGRRLRVIVVVDRDGAVSARTTFSDGDTLEGGCQGGRLVDAVRRCLRLATPPPPASSAMLLRNLWLAAVVAEGNGRGRLSWPDVARLHPAAQVLTGDGHELTPDEFEVLVRVTPRVWTWDRMRVDTAQGGGLRDLVAPELAAWMDTGMFARWTLEAHQSPVDLWGQAAALLDPDAVVRLARSLDAAEAAAGPVESGP